MGCMKMKQEQNLISSKETRDFQLYVLVGIPGSGKSTWAETHLREKPIVSRDAIRFAVIDDEEEYFSHEAEVFEKYVDSIVGACKSFGCAVADATHISKASRHKLFRNLDSKIKGRYDITLIYFNPPLKTCLKRNKLRDGRALVPEQAIYSMHGQLTRPEYGEHEAITEIWEVGGRQF